MWEGEEALEIRIDFPSPILAKCVMLERAFSQLGGLRPRPLSTICILAVSSVEVGFLFERVVFVSQSVGVRNNMRKGTMPIALGRSRKTASSLLQLDLRRDVLPAVRASGGGLNPCDPRCYRISQLKNGRFIELSPCHLMKMQGLPRSYRFPLGTSATSKRKLIGNAVCPPIAKSLLLAIREALLT